MAFNRFQVDRVALANADGLDDSIFSNAEGMTDEQKQAAIQAGVQVASGVFTAIKNRPKAITKQEYKAACGRKPLIGKAKKASYQKCVDNYLKSKSTSKESNTTNPSVIPSNSDKYFAPSDNEEKKFLGMPMGAGITVTVLAVAALAFGGYKLYVKLKK
jgi:hypothetical protein